MRIGSSIALIVIGAVLSFAVADIFSGVDLTLIGYILMAAGALGLIASMFLMAPRNNHRVSESRSVVDEATGETITRHETKGTI